MSSSTTIISILLAVVLFQSSQTAPTPAPPPMCNGTIIINPPSDLTKPYYYPATWNENMDAPAHLIDIVCSFYVNVPRGLYAKLVMKGKIEGNGYIFLNDDAPYNQYVYETNLEPYFFVGKKFYVALNTNANRALGNFGMKIVWSKLPSTTPQSMKITNGTVYPNQAADAQNGVVFETDVESSLSLVPIPISSLNQNSLRNTLVFDGPSYYSNYIGNLYKIYASRNQFVSRSSKLTILTFEPENTQDLYVIQHSRDTMDISKYTAVMCDDLKSCPTSMDATGGKAAAISISKGGETLTSANIGRTSTISVYSGVISNQYLMDTYSSSTVKSSLPRKYNVNIRQYVVNSGLAILNISRK